MNRKERDTGAVRKTYDRIAPVYDIMEGMVEMLRYRRWRQLLWSKVESTRILEVGVGTGKNFYYYPPDVDITAVDFSAQMLDRAVKRAGELGIEVRIEQMDVQHLEYADDTFDTVVGSFVFCSVPDPVKGLQEVRRVCKPGGKVVLLEHVLSANRLLALLMNLANPVAVRIMGPNINRKTVENVAASGLTVVKVTDLAFGIFKIIETRKD